MLPTEQGIYTIACADYYPRSSLSASMSSESEECPPASPATPLTRTMGRTHCGWLIDVLITASVVVFLAVVEYGILPNVPAGFYCGDPSIAHKFTGDTISVTTLLLVNVIAPIITLWLVEAYNSHISSCAGGRGMASVRCMWHWYREYLAGLIAVLFITDAAKVLVGEPRPHFIDTCRPDTAVNCTLGTYIETFTCTGQMHSERLIKDSTKSFPSGHASVSVYTVIFLIWFIQRRVSGSISYLLVPWLQCLGLIWAMTCAFSRITDHRHHWWDVLAGSVLGVLAAMFTVKTFCDGFCPPTNPARPFNGLAKANGHVTKDNRHQSIKRLLSTTSSQDGAMSMRDKELNETPMA